MYCQDSGAFALTYESSMTRLYRCVFEAGWISLFCSLLLNANSDGRTETVRPVSEPSCAFVHAMNNPAASDADRLAILRT